MTEPDVGRQELPEKIYTFPEGEDTIDIKDEKGQPAKAVLLTDGSVAIVVQGTGADVEKSTMIAGKDQTKYMSAMMASCILLKDKKVVMEDLAGFAMKDYMRLQAAFVEINF